MFVSVLLIMAGVGTTLASQPNDALICLDEPTELNADRYLRALSLDLRGRLPSAAELESLYFSEDTEAASSDLIDSLMDDNAFAEQVVRRHRTFFWPNLGNVRILAPRQDIQQSRGIWWDRDRARTYRPSATTRYRCADRPAEFGPNGEILTEPNEDGVPVEGWVEVQPYWAPDTTVRVCAFLAQDRRFTSDNVDCSTLPNHSECGCGPNLMWCGTGTMERDLQRGFVTSLERSIHRAASQDANYLDLFQANEFDINGPMVHFFKYLYRGARTPFNPLPINPQELPDLGAWEADNWVTMELPSSHAGLLTHPGFLLRFQTNRARAGRFYESFLCAPFQPPSSGLPVSDDESAREPDLQKRHGCKYCHSLLEPAASHWGRWNEQGGGYFDASAYPATNETCVECATTGRNCSRFCRDNYLTRALDAAEEPYLGMLKAYAFLKDEHLINVEYGPKLLVRMSVANHRLPTCVARKAAEWLLDRELNQSGDEEWLDEISTEFVRAQFSYRSLIKSIVTSSRYRRVQ